MALLKGFSMKWNTLYYPFSPCQADETYTKSTSPVFVNQLSTNR